MFTIPVLARIDARKVIFLNLDQINPHFGKKSLFSISTNT